jgi:hypothetical protein
MNFLKNILVFKHGENNIGGTKAGKNVDNKLHVL